MRARRGGFHGGEGWGGGFGGSLLGLGGRSNSISSHLGRAGRCQSLRRGLDREGPAEGGGGGGVEGSGLVAPGQIDGGVVPGGWPGWWSSREIELRVCYSRAVISLEGSTPHQ